MRDESRAVNEGTWRSSEANANLFSAFQSPHVMRFLCLAAAYLQSEPARVSTHSTTSMQLNTWKDGLTTRSW